jgi:hypothetical protein
MRKGRDLTVLWALRSPCNLGCDYCYFGTLEEHRESAPTALGALSHLPHGDLPVTAITAFSCALLFGHGTPLRLISCDESPGSRATGRTVRAPTI